MCGPIGVLMTDVELTSGPDSKLFAFRVLNEEFLVTAEEGVPMTSRERDVIISVGQLFWVVGPTGKGSLVRVEAHLVSKETVYYLEHWVAA